MANVKRLKPSEAEPTAAELQLIEAEWPLIAAELAVVDSEIAAARTGNDMNELDRRRTRRAQAAAVRALVEAARLSSDLDGVA